MQEQSLRMFLESRSKSVVRMSKAGSMTISLVLKARRTLYWRQISSTYTGGGIPDIEK